MKILNVAFLNNTELICSYTVKWLEVSNSFYLDTVKLLKELQSNSNTFI